MNSVSKKSMMSIASKLLILVIIAKVFTLTLLYFLPSSGVNKSEQRSYNPEYKRYNFKLLVQKEQKKEKPKKVEEKKEEIQKSTSDVTQMQEVATLVLKGLYGSKENSFVFVAKKSKPNKVKMLKIGESFEGYKLVRVEGNIAVFNFRGKEYILQFGKVDLKSYAQNTKTKSAANYKKSTPNKRVSKKPKVRKREDAATVGRSDIQYYAKNFKQIWKDISISPLKKNKKLIGFKVTRIKAGTPFAKLGLKVNDVIIRANNMELTSYKDALKIYEKIDDLNAVDIVVLRNNEEVELVYEIY